MRTRCEEQCPFCTPKKETLWMVFINGVFSVQCDKCKKEVKLTRLLSLWKAAIFGANWSK